ncbi:DUF3383 family protein [Psychrobacillus lasiicapitis]|uniref:DUF3383 domain-containing protein n=1 Tax=Psychrobacillus lasiicapitis TaxID=1636719 RepID=A0A544TAH8_9BACI|nr:DUF3383 family protein [Psychrobacillus lasiicapitis]TQR14467.1 DUF3383 domain-containing protein [Psychrobacillus lasiicapitis]GGA31085.1 hypothetical protein GCM10011384_20730 [Psychrobacillus lasiicapitis]
MPLKDVTVIINIKKPSALIGLGTPLILAEKAGEPSFKIYGDIEGVKADFAEDTDPYKAARVAFKQGDTSTAKVAIATYDGTEVTAAEALEQYYNEDWYFVSLATGTVADFIAISDVVEGEGFKIAAHTVDSLEDLTTLSAKKYDRTFVMMHDKLEQYPHLALIGGHGSKPVGSITYKFKKLIGVDPAPYDATTLLGIHALNGFAYVAKNGNYQTSEGTVLSGEYIDVIHGKDWVKVNMEQAISTLFINNDKIAFDDVGIPQIEGEARTILEIAGQQGIIAADDAGQPLYTLTAKDRAQTSAQDRVERHYKGLSFSLELAGAIHEATVYGEMVV